jgi:hypothetical protein
MKPTPLAILAVILLTPFPALHAQSSPCGCESLNDIKDRIVTVKNAINLYTDYVRDPAMTGRPWTLDDWESIEATNRGKLSSEFSPYPRSYKGRDASKTLFWCDMEIPDDVSPCIHESLTIHEQVHQSACLHPKFPPGIFENWRNVQSMMDALREDIKAYSTELFFLQQQEHRLECSCPYYAIHFNYLGVAGIQQGPLTASAATATPVPVEIPLTLKDDGTFSGEATAILQGNGTLRAPAAKCVETDQGLVRLRASGTIAGPENSPLMHLEVSSETPPENSTALHCVTGLGPYHGSFSQTGNNASVGVNLPAVVGEQQPGSFFNLQNPALGVFVSLTGVSQITETPQKAAMTAAEAWGNQTRPPDVLPVCKAKP